MTLFALLLLSVCCLSLLFYAANKCLMKTNWFKNFFIYAKDARLVQKKQNFDIKLHIVNVGSNPARFSFFYENVNGLNLSYGTQSLDLDLAVLKEYKDYLDKDCYVLLPIVPFSSISAYLEGTLELYVKYADFSSVNVSDKRLLLKARAFSKYPLLFSPTALRYLLRDSLPNKQLEIVEQHMQHLELIQDANQWLKCWKDEFGITRLGDPLTEDLLEARRNSIRIFSELIEYVLINGWKPVIISPPFSKELSELFTPQMKEVYVDSFIREFDKYQIPYLDYIYSESFSDSSLYANALYMNLKGRKMFTSDVLQKLSIHNELQ